MKSNEELQKNVVDAINWEPLLKAAEIGVLVNKGMVTLTGLVNTYAKKAEAEQAAKNVAGVRTVIEDIKVVCNTKDKRTDAEILTAIKTAFKWHWDIPTEKISVIVESGWVFLSGQIEWNYQKEASKNALNNLIGITGITNNISIISLSKDTSKKKTLK
nr:BON domain-containing protein [Flavobacterium sp.]